MKLKDFDGVRAGLAEEREFKARQAAVGWNLAIVDEVRYRVVNRSTRRLSVVAQWRGRASMRQMAFQFLNYLFRGIAFLVLAFMVGVWFSWMEYSSEEYYHGAAKVAEEWRACTRLWLVCGGIAVSAGITSVLIGRRASRAFDLSDRRRESSHA